MSLVLKSVIKYSDGKMNTRDASNSYLEISPDKLRGPYGLNPNSRVMAKVVSVEPADADVDEESFNSMYNSLSGLPIEFIFYPAYKSKDYLFLSRKNQKQFNKVGVIPNRFVVTVEIGAVKSGLFSKKVYPMAKIIDDEVDTNGK